MRDVLSEGEFDDAAVFESAGLEIGIAEEPEATVSGVEQIAFERAFVLATAGRPDLWVETGWRQSLLTAGDFGLAAITAPDLDSLTATMFDYATIRPRLGKMRTLYNSDGVRIGSETDLNEVPPELREFTVYRELGSTMRVLSEVWGETPPPLEAIEVPISVAPVQSAIRCAVPIRRGRAPRTIWKADADSRSSPSRNDLLHAFYSQRCAAVLAQTSSQQTIVDEIRAALAATPDAQSIDRIAGTLHVSVRTLQRALKHHGASFRDLQRETREAIAKEMLVSTTLTIGDIARHAGYHDISTFSAAFHSWTRMTPTAWRAAHTIDRSVAIAVRDRGPRPGRR